MSSLVPDSASNKTNIMNNRSNESDQNQESVKVSVEHVCAEGPEKTKQPNEIHSSTIQNIQQNMTMLSLKAQSCNGLAKEESISIVAPLNAIGNHGQNSKEKCLIVTPEIILPVFLFDNIPEDQSVSIKVSKGSKSALSNSNLADPNPGRKTNSLLNKLYTNLNLKKSQTTLAALLSPSSHYLDTSKSMSKSVLQVSLSNTDHGSTELARGSQEHSSKIFLAHTADAVQSRNMAVTAEATKERPSTSKTKNMICHYAPNSMLCQLINPSAATANACSTTQNSVIVATEDSFTSKTLLSLPETTVEQTRQNSLDRKSKHKGAKKREKKDKNREFQLRMDKISFVDLILGTREDYLNDFIGLCKELHHEKYFFALQDYLQLEQQIMGDGQYAKDPNREGHKTTWNRLKSTFNQKTPSPQNCHSGPSSFTSLPGHSNQTETTIAEIDTTLHMSHPTSGHSKAHRSPALLRFQELSSDEITLSDLEGPTMNVPSYIAPSLLMYYSKYFDRNTPEATRIPLSEQMHSEISECLIMGGMNKMTTAIFERLVVIVCHILYRNVFSSFINMMQSKIANGKQKESEIHSEKSKGHSGNANWMKDERSDKRRQSESGNRVKDIRTNSESANRKESESDSISDLSASNQRRYSLDPLSPLPLFSKIKNEGGFSVDGTPNHSCSGTARSSYDRNSNSSSTAPSYQRKTSGHTSTTTSNPSNIPGQTSRPRPTSSQPRPITIIGTAANAISSLFQGFKPTIAKYPHGKDLLDFEVAQEFSKEYFLFVLTNDILYEELKVYGMMDLCIENFQFLENLKKTEDLLAQSSPELHFSLYGDLEPSAAPGTYLMRFLKNARKKGSDLETIPARTTTQSPVLRFLQSSSPTHPIINSPVPHPISNSSSMTPSLNSQVNTISSSASPNHIIIPSSPTHSVINNSLQKSPSDSFHRKTNSFLNTNDLIPFSLIPEYKTLYNDFISPEAQSEINITDSLKKKIAEILSSTNYNVSIHVMDDAADHVMALVYQNTFKRFVQDKSNNILPRISNTRK